MNYWSKFLIQEGKAKIGAHTLSVIKNIDTIDRKTADKVIKALNKDDLGYERILLGTHPNTDKPYIGVFTQNRKYDNKNEIISKISKILKSVGMKVTDNKVASQELFIYFE
jgi:hypothetical protein